MRKMVDFFGRISEKRAVETVKEAERKFIYELVDDARAPLTKFAKKLRVSKDTAHYTLTKLQKSHVVVHISPIVDLTRFGFRTYHAFFVTNDDNKQKRTEFLEYLKKHAHTKSLMEYTDRWEIEWILIAKNVQEFDSIIMKTVTKFSDVIIEKMKLLVIKGYKSTTVAARHIPELKNPKSYEYDNADLKLLNFLHEDGRMSSHAIAEQLKISPNAVRYRIKKLIETNIIRSFSATINMSALGYHVYTVGLILKSLSEEQEAKMREFFRNKRFIIRAVKVLGHWDVLLTIVSDSIKHFHTTVKEIEDAFSDVIINYESLIAYEEHVFKYIPDVVMKEKK
ncbi:hypothetical protein COV18_04955 [Candidatus Woesearchaeota archaeon CG10_big_fil_rev_8_21_14_0_10_37_12]|nr:MAG: hypothetical protein COV18_04955 [Candidatus Woesearchaeota archaeon CG10_big_fil_rev_8_21_14_0_10_37_12]